MALTTAFVRHTGLSGPFGALMDEYARAAEDFCRAATNNPAGTRLRVRLKTGLSGGDGPPIHLKPGTTGDYF